MKRRFRHLLIAGVVALGLVAVPAVSQAADNSGADMTAVARGPAPSSPMEAVAAMQPGWNLGNTFDAGFGGETSWGQPLVTRELLHGVRAQGFKSIRMPVSWGEHEGPGPDYTIDPVFLARVDQVVKWALAEGLYVMINMHHDSYWMRAMPAQHDAVLARYSATWRQVSATFKDAPRKLLFESINEPTFTDSTGDAQRYELMNELNTTFHSIVRASGGKNATRILVLPTFESNGEQARLDALANTFAALDDPNVAATIHTYGYWPFSVNVAGVTTFDANSQKDIIGTFERAAATFVTKGIPVIVGEYGLLGIDTGFAPGGTDNVEQGEALKFFELFGYQARLHNITTMWWNGGGFNRTTLQWANPAIYEQMKSSWTVRSGTASSDLLFVGTGQPAADTTITLNPNGNNLISVLDGSRKLVRGRDYTVSGDQLTFKAAALSRLTASKALGVNATLKLRFSRGVPWALNIISYDTPVLTDATGTGSLVIPTAFNGDKLATMEAVYDDGTIAGPFSWTQYKPFNTAFVPNYATGQIALPSGFFDEVTDGKRVTLTMHFWSGAIVKYYVTKSGTTMTGTTMTGTTMTGTTN